MECASYLAINLSTIMIMHEYWCCDSYSALGEGAYLIDEVSIYNAIRNIIKLTAVLQDICSQWLSKWVQICEINLNTDDAEWH